jgi:hypothetical protein
MLVKNTNVGKLLLWIPTFVGMRIGKNEVLGIPL